MINLSNIPEWYPILVIGAFTTGATLMGLFAKGVTKIECKERHARGITEERIKDLIKEQLQPLTEAVHYMTIERTTLWESVRTTERNIAVIMETLKWLKERADEK